MKKGTSPTLEVIVATHKPYTIPTDSLYRPLLVGSSFFQAKYPDIKLPSIFSFDNTGKNISEKNHNYSELTGLYWLWQNRAIKDKNPDSFYGLVHYRRFFSVKDTKEILTKKTLKSLLYDLDKNIKYDIILPKKRHYFIENLYSHYAHTLHIEPLNKTRQIIQDYHPEYLAEFDRLKMRRSAHMFNIFIMRKELFNEYCEFLFDTLINLEKSLSKTELNQYDDFHARFFGRISELLLDVFLYTKYPDLDQKTNVLELKIIETEPVNWFTKITSFLLAKFFGKKYHKSY